MEEDRISTALREMLTQMYYKSGKRSTVMIDGIDCLYELSIVQLDLLYSFHILLPGRSSYS